MGRGMDITAHVDVPTEDADVERLRSRFPSGKGEADPSALATEALLREIRHLRDVLDARVAAAERSLAEYKINHHDVHVTVVDAAIANLHTLIATRFADTELRYEQRYVAQREAVEAAFLAQQTATQAALASADKAVNSALQAADKAVAKAEALNERRFETMTAVTAAVNSLNSRVEELHAKVDGLSGLTDAKFVTFRTLVDSQAEKVGIALASSDKAVSKAEVANERRFESVNEFRAQLSDQASRLISRTEASAMNDSLAARLDATLGGIEAAVIDIKTRMDRAEGKSGGYSSSGALVVAIVGIIGTVMAIIIGIGAWT